MLYNNKCLVTFDSQNLIDYNALHNFDDNCSVIEQNMTNND